MLKGFIEILNGWSRILKGVIDICKGGGWQSFDGVKGGLSGFLQYLEEEIESLNASEKEGFRCCSPEFKPTPKPQNLKNRKPQVLKPRP